jgi:hypothetical protein
MNELIKRTFIDEIVALTSGDYDVQFPDELSIQCDWSVDTVRDALNQLLNDKSCDMIIALGVIASNEVTHMRELPKPVIAPFIINPQLQETPIDGVSSGIKNLSYLTSPFNIDRDVEAFMEYAKFEKLVVLSSGPYVKAIPQLSQGHSHYFWFAVRDAVDFGRGSGTLFFVLQNSFQGLSIPRDQNLIVRCGAQRRRIL